ncbi:hypothetical protein LSTR_LSTR001875 [Laodelphax striatellus]|uniref:Uncharacterized protein n=1 Tax=Laodelphax striatellus TaxID=195883 RepID=A0A482WGV4_LAOST|nr:hypothetical protein LSTR_LSTR001875 [Laodelphax striatellus]
MKKPVTKKSNGVMKANVPSQSTDQNLKIAGVNEAVISKPTTAKSPSSVHSTNLLKSAQSTLSANPLNCSQRETSTLKPTRSHNDFGLSDLSLGPSSESGSIRNHLNSEPRPYCGRLNDQIWSRSTVLSPSRLNMDTVDSPFTTSASPPRSQRSLNESSGRGSIASNQESVCSERIYDKITPAVKLTVANQRNYYDMCPPSEFSYPAMYQFTSQLQRTYPPSPPNSTIFLNNSHSPPSNSLLPYTPLPFPFYPSFPQLQATPPLETVSNKYSYFHNIVFPALVIVLVACNLSLLGLVYYREISVKNTAM